MGNSELTGKVIKLMPYGAFVKLDEGKVGLIHVSQFEELPERGLTDPPKEGDRVIVKVTGKENGGRLNLTFLGKLNEEKITKPKGMIREDFEQKLKKFFKESQESQSAHNKRIKRHRRMAA
jgi:predicted RNA-binding protein with RPS1 domain